ncbi:hypothetical protein JL720_16622 [Aureococcus anophagefferens]|nr:hypothetical protein JL720_16622 [Aureococcus anophagefferens]
MFGHLREKFREVAKHPKGMLAAGNIVREPGPVDEKVATALATYDAAVVSSVAVDKGCPRGLGRIARGRRPVSSSGSSRSDDLARPGAAPTDDLGAAVLRLRGAVVDAAAPLDAAVERIAAALREALAAAARAAAARRRQRQRRGDDDDGGPGRASLAERVKRTTKGLRRELTRLKVAAKHRDRRAASRDAAAGRRVETWAALKDAAPRVVERVGDAQRALRRLADALRRGRRRRRAPRPRGRPSPRPAPSASRRARAADALDGAGLGDLLSSDRAAALDAGLEQRVSLAVEVGHYDGKTASLEGAADGDRVARNAEKRETAARLLEEHDHRLDEAFCAYDEVRVAVNARAAAALLGALDALWGGATPFESALPADSDAAFCPSTQFLGRVAALSGGADAPDVRIAEYDLAASSGHGSAARAARLAASPPCRIQTFNSTSMCAAARGTPGDGLGDAAWCWDHVPAGATACPTFAFASDAGLQAGVVVARNTSGARRFFGDWVDAYVDMWLPHLGKRDGDLRAVARVGSDQEPLWAIVKRALPRRDRNWALGAPPEFNARFLRPGRAAALDDDVLIVHDNAVGHYGGRGRHFDLRRWGVAPRAPAWRGLRRANGAATCASWPIFPVGPSGARRGDRGQGPRAEAAETRVALAPVASL